MRAIETLSELEVLYDPAMPGAVSKVINRLTPHYQQWINAARFLILATVSAEGTDASPRGDTGPVVRIGDNKTLYLPDWRGNNRLDSLRNIVADGRVSLLFMIPGCTNVVRVNGHAIVTTDSALTQSFARDGKTPQTVIVVTIGDVYFQCAKALMRSNLWSGANHSAAVPTAGQFIKEIEHGFDAAAYDDGYSAYAKDRMW